MTQPLEAEPVVSAEPEVVTQDGPSTAVEEPQVAADPNQPGQANGEEAPPDDAGKPNGDASKPNESADDAAAKPTRLQKRIDTLTRARHEERRARFAAEQRAAQLEAELNQSRRAQTKPNRDQFESDEDYAKALVDHQFAAREQTPAQPQDPTVAYFQDIAADGKDKFDDFEAVMNASEAPVSEAIIEAAAESPYGADILYHLAKNPALAQDIVKLSPAGQAREIGRLEAKLTAPAPKPKVSNAPPPITPGSGDAPPPPDLASASYEEYVALRRKQAGG